MEIDTKILEEICKHCDADFEKLDPFNKEILRPKRFMDIPESTQTIGGEID